MLKTDTLSISIIESLPHYKKQTALEYSSACPWCGGKDRFRFWIDKANFWCRKCETKGFATDAPGSLTISPEKLAAWREAEAAREAKTEAAKLSAVEQLNQNGRAGFYHRQMTDRKYWYEAGLNDETIDKFNLGYCTACPTYRESPSHTIPIIFRDKLYNIRHRLTSPNGCGKYRPEMAGLPSTLFNADILDKPEWMTVLVEGEKKAMVLSERGFPAVGIPGANIFPDKWIKLFEKCHRIYVVLDPGVEEQAAKIAGQLRGTCQDVRLCQLPVKPDDFFVDYGGSGPDFFEFLQLGRKR